LPDVKPHAEALKHFVKVIQGKAKNIIKPEETLNVQKILDGIYKSAATGKVVNY
ncbi:gfo/Idh/MocA family oxidoreductase, partial [bacterium]|nr:gfo/Idh/MocA family oxidoreductase [bacterium]